MLPSQLLGVTAGFNTANCFAGGCRMHGLGCNVPPTPGKLVRKQMSWLGVTWSSLCSWDLVYKDSSWRNLCFCMGFWCLFFFFFSCVEVSWDFKQAQKVWNPAPSSYAKFCNQCRSVLHHLWKRMPSCRERIYFNTQWENGGLAVLITFIF